jgi:hypothetical protein
LCPQCISAKGGIIFRKKGEEVEGGGGRGYTHYFYEGICTYCVWKLVDWRKETRDILLGEVADK